MAAAHSVARLLKTSRISGDVSKPTFATGGSTFVVVGVGACVQFQIAALLLLSVLVINSVLFRRPT